jgi:DNA-binding transcriptional regulator of glucitol operon
MYVKYFNKSKTVKDRLFHKGVTVVTKIENCNDITESSMHTNLLE